MDIIVDLSHSETAGISVIGPMTEAAVVTIRNTVDVLGVRFLPGGLPAFLREPARDLVDKRVDLDAIWPKETRRLREDFFPDGSIARRIYLLQDLLLRHRPDGSGLAVLADAIQLLSLDGGRLSVQNVADRVSLGRRKLERLFEERIGLAPRQTARVLRFRRVIRTISERRVVHWARLALDHGYFDQAHLIRDFRDFAGITPAAYRRERVQGVIRVDEGEAIPA